MLKTSFNIIFILTMSCQAVFAGGSISGRIIDSTGQPIAGISVQARRDFSYPEANADTDANGYYQLNNLPLNEYSVVAIPSSTTDYTRNVVHYINVTQEIEYPVADIVLENGALSVSGIVKDHNTSATLSNIWMLCFFKGTWASMSTDANGEYLVTNLPPGTTGVLVPSQIGYAKNEVQLELVADVSNINFELMIGGSISGTVLDENGQPVAGMWVQAADYVTNDYFDGNSTDEFGKYTIEDVPAGTYRILAETWDTVYIEQYYDHQPDWDSRTPVPLAEGEHLLGIDFDLAIGTSISGTITAPDDSPVENAEVICYVGNDYIKNAWTDINGQYTVTGLSPNRIFRLAAYPPASTNHVITLLDVPVADTPLTDVNIRLNPNGLSISGIVTDKSTEMPLENVRLSCYLEDTAYDIYGGQTFTDETGFYQLTNLPPVEIEVSAVAGTMYARFGTNVDLTADVTGRNLAIPQAASLSGILVDAKTAQPIPNIEIEYWSDRYETWTNAVSDSDGHFSLTQLPPGIANIIAMPDVDTGYSWSLSWPATWINIPEATDIQNRVIALQKGALVTGQIKHPDGSPFAWTEFDFNNKLTEGWSDTDQNGYFEIRLPLGDNGLSIELDDGYSLQNLAPIITDLSTPIDLGDIIIYSQTDGSQITGSLLNPTAAPYQGEFEVSAFPAGTTMTADNFSGFCDTGWVEVPDLGPYTLQSLPPGNYDLYIWLIKENPQGPETIAIRDIVYNVSAGATNIDLTYDSQGGTLTGAVINQYTDPILGAVAFLSDSITGNFAGLADTDADGQFTIYNFEPGTYTLTAIHPMYSNAELAVTITLGATTELPTITMDFAGIKQGSDLNGDGHTDIADIAIFTSKWMTSDPNANFDQQGLVELSDFAALAQLWMSQAIWYNEITE